MDIFSRLIIPAFRLVTGKKEVRNTALYLLISVCSRNIQKEKFIYRNIDSSPS